MVRLIRPGERGIELGHGELVQVYEAGRIIDDPAHRHTAARVEHADSLGARGAFTGGLREERRQFQGGAGDRQRPRGRPEKTAALHFNRGTG